MSKANPAPLITNKDFTPSSTLESIAAFADWATYEMPPGQPGPFSMRVYANLHKGSMFFYVLFLMNYFDNYSLGAYIYLSLHGSYGFFWLLKDFVFPDPGFARLVTASSFAMPWFVALVPYMMIPYWMIKDQPFVSNERMFVAIMIYLFGVILMVLTDAQKYIVLRERKGLITHCMHAWSRNMNYFGEILLYSSFGILC